MFNSHEPILDQIAKKDCFLSYPYESIKHYNGDQLDVFNDLTEKFNDTVGKKDGITVETKSLGTAEDLEQNVLAAVNGEVGASEVPNIFSAY